MDRRQKKTRAAIFNAFCELLEKKDFNRITVEEIIKRADVGRATFYAHFETKEFLLKELSRELFCHIFDSVGDLQNGHRHIFECDAPDSVFLHLLLHLQKNDNNLLALLTGDNDGLFLKYFKSGLSGLIEDNLFLFDSKKQEKLPRDFFINHVASVFVETVLWWVRGGMKESAETVLSYFEAAV